MIDFGKADGSAKVDVDGMRLDARAGSPRLYVTRHTGGEVVVVEPTATNKILRRIKMPFGGRSAGDLED